MSYPAGNLSIAKSEPDQVTNQLDRGSNEVTNLLDSIQRLGNRISSVLLPDQLQVSSNKPSSKTSSDLVPLANRMRDVNDSISDATSRIIDLISRVQLPE